MSEGEKPDPLARLSDEIDRARAGRAASRPAAPDNGAMQQGMAVGFRIGIEFVVAIGIATGLGWAIDRGLGTRPWGMMIFFFLGIGVGMVNVYRAVAGVGGAVGFHRPVAPPAPKDGWDDDE
ncbi:MAG TPA: AtpZ/AtpI family protein [Stellaceae bacterium]|jgi:ATP synthase protein I|nr:AtpZ/AtpI family protein [Stellaceae bacterium]